MTKSDFIAQIDKFFSDQTRSRESTKRGLLDAKEHINLLIETLNDEDTDEDTDESEDEDE